MTKTIRFGAAGVALAAALGMSSVAHAQASDTATATAEVLQALTLTADGVDLDFGAMVVSGAGTVSLDADGNFDCSSANIVCSGTTSVAGFDVTGTANKWVLINLPTSVNLEHPSFVSGDPTFGTSDYYITLDNFVSNAALLVNEFNDPLDPTLITGTHYEVQLDGTGANSFEVGGTINFDGGEVAGVYSQDFTVSVEYS